MLIEQGKRLPSVMEYAHTLMPMGFFDDESKINHYGVVSELGGNLLMPLAISASHYRFMPGLEFSARLYRGQNEFWPTCRPSIYRSNISNIEGIYWDAKSIELAAVMERHPATQDLAAYQIEGMNFAFSIDAIAQHYQYPTRLLDFSRSLDVAMFFATCKYDGKRNWYPLQSGEAVLYTVDLRELILQRGERGDFLPLGMEPLPRPEVQRALAVRLDPDENLNDMSWVQHKIIEITPELSQHYFEMFSGGKKLFPENPFDEYINGLRTNCTLPLQALEFGVDQRLLPAHPDGIAGASNALRAAGFAVKDCEVDIDQSVIQAAEYEWDLRKSDYFSRIRMRGVAGHLMIE